MKKYGVKDASGWIYTNTHAESDISYRDCFDMDGKFGTDDINKAYRFAELYRISSKVGQEVFEKDAQ